MVRDHFPMNHTDDPLADGLQPRFTTVHHDLQFGLQNKQSKTKQQQKKCNKALGHS